MGISSGLRVCRRILLRLKHLHDGLDDLLDGLAAGGDDVIGHFQIKRLPL